jgi:hypothetical protein
MKKSLNSRAHSGKPIRETESEMIGEGSKKPLGLLAFDAMPWDTVGNRSYEV